MPMLLVAAALWLVVWYLVAAVVTRAGPRARGSTAAG